MNPTRNTPIKVSIVEDDARVRGSLRMLLDGTPGFLCSGLHATAEDAIQFIPGMDPDVVLMDINLPEKSGVDCARELKALRPDLLVLMLTAYADDDLIFTALSAGADGYLLKQTAPAELLSAILEVVNGGAPMTSNIARKVILSFHEDHPKDPSMIGLSRRESEILTYLTRGYFYKEIAEEMHVTFETVHSHVRNIYNKMHLRNRHAVVGHFAGHRGPKSAAPIKR